MLENREDYLKRAAAKQIKSLSTEIDGLAINVDKSSRDTERQEMREFYPHPQAMLTQDQLWE